jgi:hypothetical protein
MYPARLEERVKNSFVRCGRCGFSVVVNQNVLLVDLRGCKEDMVHLPWSYGLRNTTMFPIYQQKNDYNRRDRSTGITQQAGKDREMI